MTTSLNLRSPGKFNGIKNFMLKEEFDRIALEYIVKNFDTLTFRPDTDKTATKANVEKYLDASCGEAYANITYNQAKHSTGRYFAKGRVGTWSPSQQGMCREIRHTIARNIYDDIDIENAHPSLFSQFCTSRNIACPLLNQYVENRDAVREMICNETNNAKSTVKQEIIALLNGGHGTISHNWLAAFKFEISNIHKLISQIAPQYLAIAKKNKANQNSSFNINGAAFNALICDIENDILHEMRLSFEHMGFTVGVLVFDGIQVKKNNITPEILQAVETNVYTKTRYRIRLSIKEMSDGFEIPATAVASIFLAANDDIASDIFIQQIKEVVRKCESVVYVKVNNVWTSESAAVNAELLCRCLTSNIFKKGKKGLLPYSSDVRGSQSIIKATLCKLKNYSNLVSESKKTTLGKVCFVNGVYDLASQTLHPWEDVPEVMCLVTTDRELGPRNEEMIAIIHSRLLDTIFGEQDRKNTWLEHIARSIGGFVGDKWWTASFGERNSGKGLLTKACERAFGKYVNTLNGDSFIMERSNDGDCAKRQGFLKECELPRLTFTSEIKLDESNKHVKLNGNMLKKFASGGDLLNARLLYCNASLFTVGGSLNIMCNDLPPIDPKDAIENMMVFNMPFKYMSTEEFGENPLPCFRVRDDTIKDWLEEETVIDAFSWAVFDMFKPARVVPSTIVHGDGLRFRDGEEDELAVMRKWIINTGNPTDVITRAMLRDFITKYNLNMTIKKGGERLLKMGGIYKRDQHGVLYQNLVIINHSSVDSEDHPDNEILDLLPI